MIYLIDFLVSYGRPLYLFAPPNWLENAAVRNDVNPGAIPAAPFYTGSKTHIIGRAATRVARLL